MRNMSGSSLLDLSQGATGSVSVSDLKVSDSCPLDPGSIPEPAKDPSCILMVAEAR